MITELVPTIDVEVVSDAAQRGHHRYGPSKLNYVSDCPGWESHEGDAFTKAAGERGTTLHDIMEATLREWSKHPAPLLKILSAVTAANPVDDQDFEALSFCCIEVERHISRPGAKVYLESKVPVLNPDGSELNFGYLDILVVTGEVGVIIDYKFGSLLVRDSGANRQGFCYALGTFQRLAALKKLGVIFIQPKHHWVTRRIFDRTQMEQLYEVIRGAIDISVVYHSDPEKNTHLLNPCSGCSYCKNKLSCPAGLKHTLAVTRAIAPAAVPQSMALDKIQTPEQAALCRNAVDLVEEFIQGIKARAREIAEANGGVIEARLPSGETVCYELEDRRMDRSLGDTLEVVEALAPILEEKRLFGAAEFSLGKLQDLVAQEIYENNNAPLQAELAKGIMDIEQKVTMGVLTKKDAKREISILRQSVGERKITKKQAAEQFESILSAEGLLSRPDGVIKALRKKQTPKQLSQ